MKRFQVATVAIGAAEALRASYASSSLSQFFGEDFFGGIFQFTKHISMIGDAKTLKACFKFPAHVPQTAVDITCSKQVGNVENFGDRVENKFDNAVDDVENFPENAANWTGEQVGKVENFGDDVEQSWDNGVDRIEDFGDRMDNAYDDGRDEARYGDDDDY